MNTTSKELRLLTVDDDAAWQTYLTYLLAHPGFKIDQAADGGKALIKLQVREYDVMITDTLMPDVNGIELTRKAKKLYPKMKIILLYSAGRSPGYPKPKEAASCGADLILTKDEVANPLVRYLAHLMVPNR